jgi:signal transduction histidine kinase/signal recognition particle receptor subunit beta
MAQWSRADHTLHTKIVYYGPAFGGKTTNLVSLHRITDPQGRHELLSVQTTDDRTLFFDLLPFELGDILGYRVAMKLYTVPGQVRYEKTRQVVLNGADAIVFVADSSASREEQNRWSLQNLQMNMRAKRLDPKKIPVLFQFNKQDLPDAAPPETVARWLRMSPEQGVAAVATVGTGVLETFIAATNAMLQRLVGLADERTRRQIDTRQLEQHLQRAFAPIVARRQVSGTGTGPGDHSLPHAPLVVEGDDLVQCSVRTSVELGERLTSEQARTHRLEREADALRGVSELLREIGPTFDRQAIVESTLTSAGEILGAAGVSLIAHDAAGGARLEHAWGHTEDPLLPLAAGRELLRHLIEAGRPCVIDDLSAALDDPAAAGELGGLRAAAAVPIGGKQQRTLTAYAAQPDGAFGREDVRFLATVGGHLTAGLQKARLHQELASQRDRLEESVNARTAQLRRAYDELRGMEQMKDRFLNNLSHEMKSPLTAILTSAAFLRDYKSNDEERSEMVRSIIDCSETLERLLDDLLRVSAADAAPRALQVQRVTVGDFAGQVLRLAGNERVRCTIGDSPKAVHVDPERLARAVLNMLDNALKFSEEADPVELCFNPARLRVGEREVSAVGISVIDAGPGVAAEDRVRIFEPFEQGGEQLTAKPGGIGLGLHEARMIVREHGGVLEHLNRDVGGSEFRITVPIKPVIRRVEQEAVSA